MTGVLDASMAVAWLFKRTDATEAALAEEALRNLPADLWVVPAIWHAEVGNALIRGERAGLVPASQTMFFLSMLGASPIETDQESAQAHLPQVLALARAYSLTVYDAFYLELLLRMGGVLATFDRQLAQAVRKAGGRVFGDPA